MLRIMFVCPTVISLVEFFWQIIIPTIFYWFYGISKECKELNKFNT
jgi:hypothetical protein